MTITRKTLETMIKRLNTINGFNNPEWNEIGSYKLYKDGCGWSVQKVLNANGGV